MHRSLLLAPATREKHRVNEPNFASAGLVSQEKYLLLVGVCFRVGSRRVTVGHSAQREESVFVPDFLADLLVLGRRVIAFRGIFQLAVQVGDLLFDILDSLLFLGDLRLFIL
jgi:hypothetical protein